MKKVLIALDYNPSAEKIAETGYALAKSTGAEIILMHVVAEPNYYSTLDYSPIMGYTGFSSPDMLMLVDDSEVKKHPWISWNNQKSIWEMKILQRCWAKVIVLKPFSRQRQN